MDTIYTLNYKIKLNAEVWFKNVSITVSDEAVSKEGYFAKKD